MADPVVAGVAVGDRIRRNGRSQLGIVAC